MQELAEGDERPVGAVGAMLPDLWRMADRRVRPRQVDHDAAREPTLAALLAGIEHHRAIDRWFHRSRVFTEGERALRRRFFETKSPKLLLFAHPAWEMCLDGALLRARGSLEVTEALAPSLERAAPHLAAAADLHHFDDLDDPAARSRFAARMQRIVVAARDGSLHDDYLEAGGIARRLAGMRMAFALGTPSAAELAAWTEALTIAVAEADLALSRLFDERREPGVAAVDQAP